MAENSRGYEAFSRVWESLRLDLAASSLEPDKTITVAHLQPDSRDRVASLPSLSMAGSSAGTGELVPEGVLGEGGLAVVELATQRSLGREVAVKRLKPSLQSSELTWKLLQEAWITGRLEHPNIVPVHMLGRFEDGAVAMVMKRIEGKPWRAFIQGKATPPGESFAEDPLGWHLEILIGVCRAIEYAHSRGIVHRDIKPDNVMVGAFGEVYVVDWGVAVSLEEEPDGRLPVIRKARGIAGTPAYMAPEMVAAQNTLIDERTDVYLLGATLYEVVTGAPPHQQDSLFETLYSAFRSEPVETLEQVPEELAAICRKAMHPYRKDRYPSVAEFREAVARFLRHRHSRTVARQARQRLETLRETIAASQDQAGNAVRVHDLFGQCRFGFHEALREWADNPEARQGLQEAIECVARFEIDQGNPHAAEVLVGQLPQPNSSLQKKLDGLKQKVQKEREAVAALRKLGRNLDLTAGSRFRRHLFSGILLFWAVVALGAGFLRRTLSILITPAHYLFAMALLLAVTLAVLWWQREVLLQNAVNRAMMVLFLLVVVGFFPQAMVGVRWGLPFDKVVALALAVLALGASMVAATINWRIWVMALSYWVAMGCAVAWPAWSLETVAGANVVGVLSVEFMLRRWPLARPGQPREERAGHRWQGPPGALDGAPVSDAHRDARSRSRPPRGDGPPVPRHDEESA